MNGRTTSLDKIAEKFTDPTQVALLSDGGAGAEKIRTFDDRRNGNYYTERADECRKELRRKRCRYLITVFDLIVKNGSFRQESITELMDKKHQKYAAAERIYLRHRKKILFFFNVQ